MKVSSLKAMIDIAASVLHRVVEKRTSLDRAFQEVVHGVGSRLYEKVPHRALYRMCRHVVSNYLKLRYLDREVLGHRRPSFRRLVREWIALELDRLDELLGIEGASEGFKRIVDPSTDLRNLFEEALQRVEDPIERASIELSYPRWLVEELSRVMGLDEAIQLLKRMNEVEDLWIRVNTLRSDVDRVVRELEEQGVVVERDGDLWYMLRVVDYERPLHRLPQLSRCEIVMQDKASAMVVEALEPEPGDQILDLAAAPGVKASLVMQLTDNRARLVLIDVSRERVSRMKRFLKCMGVDTDRIDIALADSTRLSLSRSLDKALVDAPCTGSGTVSRDPAVKVFLEDEATVPELQRIQRGMLATALRHAGTTVFATCSVLPREGEEIVSDVSDRLVDPGIAAGSPGYSAYPFSGLVRRFFPHRHATHGFFIAKLVRR